MIKLSFVVTAIEKDQYHLFQMLYSYFNMSNCEETEMLIILNHASQSFQKELDELAAENENLTYFVLEGLNRCARRDYGAKLAHSEFIAFIDADCIIDKEYYICAKKHLDKIIFRGTNHYQSSSWFNKMQSIYRSLCDEKFFAEETFTPNLVIDRQLLFKAGGWDLCNIDFGDDFNLSRRIRLFYKERIMILPDMNLQINPDIKKSKSVKTWFRNGQAYAFRYYHLNFNQKRLWESSPFLVYNRGNSLAYKTFAVFVNFVMKCGFLYGLKIYKNIMYLVMAENMRKFLKYRIK